MTMSLAFEEFGHAGQSPLIILHGFFASSRNWRQIAQKLAEHFHVYVPDCRNHGASPHHAQMDYMVMAEDVLAFIQQQNLNKVSLLGHSMGGKTAMWFALNYSSYLNKLIVADIAPVNYQHCFTSLIESLHTLPVAEMQSRKQADDYLAMQIPETSYRQFLLQNLVLHQGQYQWRIDLTIFQQNAANIVSFPDTQAIQPYCGNTLFLIGALSNYVNAAYYALFPLAQFIALAQAGHWLHVQQPTAFVEAVLAFLHK